MEVKDVYTDISNPAAFSGINNVYKEVKKVNPKITMNQVKAELAKMRTYTIHKPRRLRFPRLKTIPTGYMTDMQADLADFQKVSDLNKGFKYCLVAVDVL